MLPLIPLVLAGGAAAMALGWYLSEDQKLRRMIRGAARVPIAEFPHGGYHRIVGELQIEDGALYAPLTGRRCAAYEVRLEQGGFANSAQWVTLVHEVRKRRFVINDGTGHAYVDPDGAQLVLTVDNRSKSGTFDDPTDREAAFLARYTRDEPYWLSNRRLRYSEAVLEPGELVTVLGRGKVSYDDQSPPERQLSGYRRPANATKLEIADSDLPLYISDDESLLR